MRALKIVMMLWVGCLLAGCENTLTCSNPSSVNLVQQLPCNNCIYRGVAKPDLCPNGTFSHKLQCSASKMGGNVVIFEPYKKGMVTGFPVYHCPMARPYEVPSNCKTDVSHSCG